MATRPVGTIYPRARGKRFTVLNQVVDDIIEAVVQCNFCDPDETFPETEREQHAYVWRKVRDYASKVIKYHKY